MSAGNRRVKRNNFTLQVFVQFRLYLQKYNNHNRSNTFFALLRHLFSSMSFQLFLQRTLFTCDVSWMNASVYEILHWLLPRPMLSIHTHSHSHHNSSAFRVLSSEWVCFQPCYNGSLWLSQSTPFQAASRVQLCITVKWLFKSELSLWLQLYCVDCVPTDTSAGSFT